MNYGLLYGIVAYDFGLLGFPGTYYGGLVDVSLLGQHAARSPNPRPQAASLTGSPEMYSRRSDARTQSDSRRKPKAASGSHTSCGFASSSKAEVSLMPGHAPHPEPSAFRTVCALGMATYILRVLPSTTKPIIFMGSSSFCTRLTIHRCILKKNLQE